MKLSDLYTNLSYGVLSNLSIGGEGSGTIPVEHQDRMLHHVHRGLTALHTRYLMVAKELVIRAYDDITLYRLHSDYADSTSVIVAQKYISDTSADPFLDDLLRILVIQDEEGNEVPLNDSKEDTSLFTPTPSTLQIPQPVTGNTYFLLYQADHPRLAPGDLTQEVSIPGMLEEPLEAYIAYRVLCAMNGQEHAAKANEHLQRYEMLCDRIERKDLLSTSQVETVSKFHARGFV